ncbi:general substrate transporter [Dacryopinax primogenitus]|uniref:General substrate transporter n=1 Tax=Dacryopinax primogenitus (strain DJM 731) TaxID=1858805 RepID=M5FVX3_DACPD|nr:general substrate transporter [Dacryopinax primogenitus]EJU00509.1 general substrate transporter [Dacryopinax primogenitus]
MALSPTEVHVDSSKLDNTSDLAKIDYNGATDVVKQKQETLREAFDADPGIPFFSPRALQFAYIVAVVLCCSGDAGYDGTVMSAISSMVQYQQYFNLQAASSKTGIVFGIYTIGQIASFLTCATLPDWFGRRWGMLLGNLCLVTGSVVTANVNAMPMFIAGRFLTGLGTSTAGVSARSYLAEITSPATRGRYVGLLNSFFYVGQIIASGIAIPTGRYSDNMPWRAPIYVQGLPAVINVVLVLGLPESPRWLYTNGKTQQATQILAKYHSKNNDINSPMIQLQLAEIEESISPDGSDRRWWDFRPLFKTRADRYRIWLVTLVAAGSSWAGNGLLTNYLTILLNQAGITDPDRQRVLNFVNSVTSFIGALLGTASVDYVGRRTIVLTAIFACGTGRQRNARVIIAGLLSTAGTNVAQANAGISFIFLFMVFFSYGWTPMQALYPVEVMSYEGRAKGLAWYTLISQGTNCVNTFAMPVALANIQWKTYIIFGVFDFCLLGVVWYYFVEPKQLTLEEMDQVFASDNPRLTSLELQRVAKERRRTLKLRHMEKAAV